MKVLRHLIPQAGLAKVQGVSEDKELQDSPEVTGLRIGTGRDTCRL